MSIKIKEFMLDFIEESNKILLELWKSKKEVSYISTDKEIINFFFDFLNWENYSCWSQLISLCEESWMKNKWTNINWNDYRIIKTIWWKENCWTLENIIFEKKEKWTWELSYFILNWDYNSWNWTTYKYVSECEIEEIENYSYNDIIYY